jgi:hypothetical protein
LKDVDDANAHLRAAQDNPTAAVRPLQIAIGRIFSAPRWRTKMARLIGEMTLWSTVQHQLPPSGRSCTIWWEGYRRAGRYF